MNALRQTAGFGLILLGILWGGLFLAGCQSTPPPVYTNVPGLPGSATNGQAGQVSPASRGTAIFHSGDQVTIIFSPQQVIQPFQEAIKDDGTISPPYLGPTVAAGKSPGELQRELQTKYDKLYKNLTVTVQSKERYYYVYGEVKQAGPCLYLGDTTILQAISAAHGFTDYAKKKAVQVTRAGSRKTIKVNCVEAQENPQANVPVYPGDTIWVPRRLF